MGVHSMQQDNDRLTGRGLLGRGAMTGLAALALVGGGAGVALADEAPADAGHDATQSAQQHASKVSDEGKASLGQGFGQGFGQGVREGLGPEELGEEGLGPEGFGPEGLRRGRLAALEPARRGLAPVAADLPADVPAHLASDVAAGLGGLAPEPLGHERRPHLRREPAGPQATDAARASRSPRASSEATVVLGGRNHLGSARRRVSGVGRRRGTRGSGRQTPSPCQFPSCCESSRRKSS